MSILFLDDSAVRQRRLLMDYPHATVASTAHDCIQHLKTGPWVTLCLDHDLGGETYVDSDRTDTGMEVVRWIEENKPSIQNIIVHSLNYDAAKEMVLRLKNAGYDAEFQPFGVTWAKPWTANER